ncbi:MAG: sulfur carrier protein ThiS [Thermoanaerobaculia bacterium]
MSERAEVRVLLNGEARSLASGLTVAGLVRDLGQDPRAVAVEYNGRILPRGRYSETLVHEGDRIEVVHFVQGG